jgi:hypothetical protein
VLQGYEAGRTSSLRTKSFRGARLAEWPQLNQRLDVVDVRLRLTGRAGEVPVDVGDRITTLRPIAVFSKGASEIEFRLDASRFLADLAENG